MKIKEIVIAGTGSIDQCDHCEKEYLKEGNACFIVEGWISINLCNKCIKKYKLYKTNKNENN